jgi:hypothetical protein
MKASEQLFGSLRELTSTLGDRKEGIYVDR